jgi:hypothetical protein
LVEADEEATGVGKDVIDFVSRIDGIDGAVAVE